MEGHAMLQSSMRKRHEGEGGFTLVELLVVIVILGVLSAVVVFAVGGISNKSKASACAADLNAVTTAEETYIAQHPGVFQDIPGLVTATLLRSAPSTTNGYVITASATTGVVTVAPACSTL